MTLATAPSTQPSVHVNRQADRVELEGVRGFSFAQMQSSTYATMAEVCRVLGENIDYEELVGGSGLAFRTQIFKDHMCPSAPHAMVGYACKSDAFQPWTFRVWFLADEKPEGPKYARQVVEMRAAVKDSIDRGVPAILIAEEDGLIVGYQKGGAEWICYHPMHERGQATYVETSVRWGAVVPDAPRSGLPSRHDVAVSAIRRAVGGWSADSERYYVGEKAWQVWIERIEAVEAGKLKPDDAQLTNAWMYECLAAHRRNAAGYLRRVAGEFDGADAAHLEKAADLYWAMASSTLCSPDHGVMTIAPYPSKDKPWTSEQRRDQLQRMRQAQTLDQQAIAELKRVGR